MNAIPFLVVLLSMCLIAHGQEFAQNKLTEVPGKMKEMIAANEMAGAVTCLATRDGIAHLEAVGLADVANHKPMQTDSIFWIASMTKPVTGSAILMLQEEGKLSIDDPVTKYVPEFARVKTPSGAPAKITLKQLLSHTSGLAEVPKGTPRAKNLAELIPQFVGEPTQFEPGTQWRYCQTGINTLGRIIEIVSGQSYPDFLQQHILDPLGMKDTTFYPTAEQLKRLAKSYKRTDDGKLEEAPIFAFEGLDLTSHDRIPLANGGLFSTAPDYARFMRMLLNGGTLEGKTYLKPETVKLMTSNLSGDTKAGFVAGRHHWGCAVGVVEVPEGVTAMLSPGTFGHGGAYGTQAWADPVKGVAYILMVQRSNFKNSDDSPVRKAFQQAAAEAIK